MRDLDQLRERGDEGTGRKLTVVALGTLVAVAAVFAMGILVGQTDHASAEAGEDPLAQLDRAAGATPPPAAAEPPRAENVAPEDLSFPAALTTDPLVEAAVEAAAKEHAALAAPSPHAAAVPPIPLTPTLGTSSQALHAAMPAAATASGKGARLARVAKHDALVRAALPRADGTPKVASGHPGKFTLQVVSYESRPAADEFADSLRARSHKAFVMSADVPGRGRYFRVRIGPFENRREAAAYQAKFERDERMHTLVVRNPDHPK